MKKYRLLIILLLCIFMCGCGKNTTNNTKEDNTTKLNSKLNEELKNTISFAVKGEENLVALTSDGKEVTIYDGRYGSRFYYYFDNDSTIYISLIDGEKKNVVGKIDLTKGNNTYDLEVLFSKAFNDYYPAYITKLGDKLYLSINEIYEYDLNTKEINKLGIKDPKRYSNLLTLDNLLYYHTNKGVYSYNPETKETKEISKEGSVAFIYKDKLIYYYNGGHNGEYDSSKDLSYYSYDSKTEWSTRISKMYGVQSLDEEFVVPFEDNFYSLDWYNTINVFDGKEVKEFYKFSCDDFKGLIDSCSDFDMVEISKLVKVSDDTLWLEFGNEMDAIFYYYKFNINTKKLSKVDSTDKYTSIQYVY